MSRVAFLEAWGNIDVARPMAKRADVELILRDIGAAQYGVLTRAQLLAHGLTRHVIDGLVRTRRLLVLSPGVYRVTPVPPPRAAEAAAVLACGGEGRISHRSAGALQGLVAATANVEVSMPRRRRRRIEGVRIHRVRDLREDEVTTVNGLPVTTPARTLLDLGEVLLRRELEQAVATALRQRLVTRADLHVMLERHPKHRGAPRLREVIEADGGTAFTRSEAEAELLEIVRGAKLPRPRVNVQVLGHEADFLWPDVRVVAEVDGYGFHSSPRAFAEDRRRDAELTAAGYRVLRFTWADVTEGRLATAARLASALAR